MPESLENSLPLTIRRLQERAVTVYGNPRVYKALKNQMTGILTELKRIRTGDPVDEDLKEIIKMMNLIMDGMKEGNRGM